MSRKRSGLASVALAAVLLASTAATANAHVSPTYLVFGVEVWATSTVGTFVGEAVGSDGDLAMWRASIEHTVQTQPSGDITGGRAVVRTSDLTRVTGRFKSGWLRLIDDGGEGCGDLKHRVRGKLSRITRSDSGAVGKGSCARSWSTTGCRSSGAASPTPRLRKARSASRSDTGRAWVGSPRHAGAGSGS